jgi:hypothetical protein
MDFELELALPLAIAVVGHAAFAAFEVPHGLGLCGVAFHAWWRARHGIHPIHALPRRRYYELCGWTWRDEETAWPPPHTSR